MKLAEGLLLRADLKKKITQLVNRITPVLKIAQGKRPQEDPHKLLAQLRQAVRDFEAIVVRINKTNVITTIPNEGTLMEALARRDALKTLLTHLRTLRQGAQLHNQTYSSSLETTIELKSLQSEVDQTGRAFRELDTKIQEMNWTTELCD